MQCRRRTEDQCCQQRYAGSEAQNTNIDVEFHPEWKLIRNSREHQINAPKGERQTKRAADYTEEKALGEQLAEDAPAAGSERRSNSNLPLSRRCPRQQQVGDVRAGDQQYQSHYSE